MTDMHIDELIETLKNGADRRVQRNLGILHAVCLEERKKERPNLTTTNIGRLSKALNGVGAAHLYGRAGERYRKLLDAHRLVANRSRIKQPITTPSPVENENYLIDRIENVSARQLVKVIRAERDKLRRENRTLRDAFESHAVRLMRSGSTPEIEPTGHDLVATLNPGDLAALHEAFAQYRLSFLGWSVKDDGSIIGAGRRPMTIFSLGFMIAYQKVLDALVEETGGTATYALPD